jgi:undecaprenyl-diphosphatase
LFYFVLIGLAAAFAVMLLFGGLDLDRALLLVGYAGGNPELARYARALTELGNGRFLIPVTGAATLYLLVTRRWIQAVVLLATTAGGCLVVEIMKRQFVRVRPEDFRHLVELDPLLPGGSIASFPSAHAANTTIVFLSMALLLAIGPRSRAWAVWAAVWLILAVGATRVMLGVHWPTDVIGGWTFGLFWTLLLLRLSGQAIDDGTPRPVRHFPSEGESHERPEQAVPGGPGPAAGGRSPPHG